MALGLLEASAEIGLSKTLGFGLVSTRLGYQVRQSTGDNAANVTLLDTTHSVSFGNSGSGTAYAGLGLDIDLAGAELNLDALGYFAGPVSGGNASATLAGAF
jgi:hypothetical protein